MDEAHLGVERWRATVEQAAALPIPEGQRSAEVFSHGTMVVKYYAPRGRDEQTPHTRDELYVVAQGSAPSSTVTINTPSPPETYCSSGRVCPTASRTSRTTSVRG